MAKKSSCGNLDCAAWVLLLVGGLNWGLVGLGSLMGSGSWDVLQMLLGGMPMVRDVVYLLVGLSALLLAYRKYS